MSKKQQKVRRKFTKEFKLDAVQLLDTRQKAGAELEKDLGLAPGQVYRWRKELRIDGQHAFPGNGNPRDEEICRLRKENAVLREEREILRKALAIFSTAQK